MEVETETRLINGIVLLHTGINLLKREGEELPEVPELMDYELSPMIEKVSTLTGNCLEYPIIETFIDGIKHNPNEEIMDMKIKLLDIMKKKKKLNFEVEFRIQKEEVTIEKPDNFIEKYVVDYSSQIRTLRYPININKNNTIN